MLSYTLNVRESREDGGDQTDYAATNRYLIPNMLQSSGTRKRLLFSMILAIGIFWIPAWISAKSAPDAAEIMGWEKNGLGETSLLVSTFYSNAVQTIGAAFFFMSGILHWQMKSTPEHDLDCCRQWGGKLWMIASGVASLFIGICNAIAILSASDIDINSPKDLLDACKNYVGMMFSALLLVIANPTYIINMVNNIKRACSRNLSPGMKDFNKIMAIVGGYSKANAVTTQRSPLNSYSSDAQRNKVRCPQFLTWPILGTTGIGFIISLMSYLFLGSDAFPELGPVLRFFPATISQGITCCTRILTLFGLASFLAEMAEAHLSVLKTLLGRQPCGTTYAKMRLARVICAWFNFSACVFSVATAIPASLHQINFFWGETNKSLTFKEMEAGQQAIVSITWYGTWIVNSYLTDGMGWFLVQIIILIIYWEQIKNLSTYDIVSTERTRGPMLASTRGLVDEQGQHRVHGEKPAEKYCCWSLNREAGRSTADEEHRSSVELISSKISLGHA